MQKENKMIVYVETDEYRGYGKNTSHYYVKDDQITKIHKNKEFGTSIIELEDGSTIDKVRKLNYPTTTNIDAVTVNQSTDISGLTSALDKMNETLEKVLDKLS